MNSGNSKAKSVLLSTASNSNAVGSVMSFNTPAKKQPSHTRISSILDFTDQKHSKRDSTADYTRDSLEDESPRKLEDLFGPWTSKKKTQPAQQKLSPKSGNFWVSKRSIRGGKSQQETAAGSNPDGFSSTEKDETTVRSLGQSIQRDLSVKIEDRCFELAKKVLERVNSASFGQAGMSLAIIKFVRREFGVVNHSKGINDFWDELLKIGNLDFSKEYKLVKALFGLPVQKKVSAKIVSQKKVLVSPGPSAGFLDKSPKAKSTVPVS